MAAAKTVGILPFLFDKSDLFANDMFKKLNNDINDVILIFNLKIFNKLNDDNEL